MEYIKTVKYYVSGSQKFFDIFKCVIDEVDVGTDTKGRKTIQVTAGKEILKGLWNKQVLDHLTENEGLESFIVLWKSPKGDYMLAYSWDIWADYRDGVTSSDVVEYVASEETGEAFLYMWIDKSNDRKYIGYHKGTIEDGYICSSESMLTVYGERPADFIRTILAYGTQSAMHELETILLLQLGAATRGSFYNISNNLRA